MRMGYCPVCASPGCVKVVKIRGVVTFSRQGGPSRLCDPKRDMSIRQEIS